MSWHPDWPSKIVLGEKHQTISYKQKLGEDVMRINNPRKADEGQINIIILLLKNENKAFKSRIPHPSKDLSQISSKTSSKVSQTHC